MSKEPFISKTVVGRTFQEFAESFLQAQSILTVPPDWEFTLPTKAEAAELRKRLIGFLDSCELNHQDWDVIQDERQVIIFECSPDEDHASCQ